MTAIETALLLLLAALPLAQLVLAGIVLPAPPPRAPDVSRVEVGPEALRSMAARAQHRGALVRRAEERRFDPGRGNRRRG